MTRPGSVPLSELTSYCVTRWESPEHVADRGAFYILDGYLRPWMLQGRPGQQTVYLIEFTTGDGASVRFALGWSPMREQVIEMVQRCGAPVGPCRLISKPLYDGMNIWEIVGVSESGDVVYDRLSDLSGPEPDASPYVTL